MRNSAYPTATKLVQTTPLRETFNERALRVCRKDRVLQLARNDAEWTDLFDGTDRNGEWYWTKQLCSGFACVETDADWVQALKHCFGLHWTVPLLRKHAPAFGPLAWSQVSLLPVHAWHDPGAVEFIQSNWDRFADDDRACLFSRAPWKLWKNMVAEGFEPTEYQIACAARNPDVDAEFALTWSHRLSDDGFESLCCNQPELRQWVLAGFFRNSVLLMAFPWMDRDVPNLVVDYLLPLLPPVHQRSSGCFSCIGRRT